MIIKPGWTDEQLRYFLFGYCYRSAQEVLPKGSSEEINDMANNLMREALEKRARGEF